MMASIQSFLLDNCSVVALAALAAIAAKAR